MPQSPAPDPFYPTLKELQDLVANSKLTPLVYPPIQPAMTCVISRGGAGKWFPRITFTIELHRQKRVSDTGIVQWRWVYLGPIDLTVNE